MKVAIMGAGLSGLSCAIMLEKKGISPVIFEKRNDVGDRFINGEIFFPFLTRPINDPIQYLSDEFGIFLKPISFINPFVIHSENSTAIIDEFVGFTSIRGRHSASFEKQLAEQVKSNIIFNSNVSIEELAEKYTHVILATGDASYSIKLKNYQEDLSVSMKGATVEGNFERSQVMAWLDYNLAPNGYAYLIPFSNKEANIVIAYPDSPNQTDEKASFFWEQFYSRVCAELKQSLKITDQFQIKNYQIGICKYPRIGSTFFTGNCFGSIMPFLGFGQFEAILTGVYAAYDLCGLGNYEELTKPLKKSYQHSLTLRRALEALNNTSIDLIVNQLNGNLGERLFKPSQHNFLKIISTLLLPFVRKNINN